MKQDALSSTFAALADPTRRAILKRLSRGEATVTELAEPFQLSLPGISKHLKVLEQSGLISRTREAQWRRCRLEGKRLKEAAAWIQGYREFWVQSFDRLDELLHEVQISSKESKRGQTRD